MLIYLYVSIDNTSFDNDSVISLAHSVCKKKSPLEFVSGLCPKKNIA